MTIAYDRYYQSENLFGEPYPELIQLFSGFSKGRVLDLGCGQGRDAISLARLGFDVTGIDSSNVGISQMNAIAQVEGLSLKGLVDDIFSYFKFSGFQFILLDSMFHFTKKDRKKETDFIKNVLTRIDPECIVVICIQDTGQKVEILNETLNSAKTERMSDNKFQYVFEDSESGHTSETDYRMIVVRRSN